MPHFRWCAKSHKNNGGHVFHSKKTLVGQAHKLADVSSTVTMTVQSNCSTLNIWIIF